MKRREEKRREEMRREERSRGAASLSPSPPTHSANE
jgi:hypothetical protein